MAAALSRDACCYKCYAGIYPGLADMHCGDVGEADLLLLISLSDVLDSRAEVKLPLSSEHSTDIVRRRLSRLQQVQCPREQAVESDMFGGGIRRGGRLPLTAPSCALSGRKS